MNESSKLLLSSLRGIVRPSGVRYYPSSTERLKRGSRFVTLSLFDRKARRTSEVTSTSHSTEEEPFPVQVLVCRLLPVSFALKEGSDRL